jgi:hypothetical protein
LSLRKAPWHPHLQLNLSITVSLVAETQYFG